MKLRLLSLIYFCLLLGLQGYAQSCTLAVNLTESASSICSGYNVTLTAATSGGKAPFNYVWNTGETTSSINVNKAGTYTVSVSDNTPGCQSVKQNVTIDVSTTPDAPTAQSLIVCPNTSATLTATAPGGTYQWYDAPNGGNFLATGATFVTPPITENTAYYVETTVGGCTSPRTGVVVQLPNSPVATPANVCSGNMATLTAKGYALTWTDSQGNVLGTGNIFTTPVLTKNTTYYVSSASNGCISSPTSVLVTVTPKPQNPVASNASICSGSSANLHADAPSGIFFWYNTPTGGVPIISSQDFTTPALTSSTVYYVSASSLDCESGRTKVSVTVNAPPIAPPTQNTTICYQTSTMLTAGGTAVNDEWYDAPGGGNLLATGITFNTPVLTNSTTYYVQADNGSCLSSRAAIIVTVNPQLPAPEVQGKITCYGTGAALTAVSSGGGSFKWYSAANGGALLATGADFTTPPLIANTTYYVQNVIAGCVSPLAPVTVAVLAAVPPPIVSGVSVCPGGTASLSASGSNSGYAWYDAASGGNLLSNNQVFITPALTATTTYYVGSTLNGCISSLVPVIVTVNPDPSPPAITGLTTICEGSTTTLTASATTGTINWFDAHGNLINIGNTFTTPPLSVNTTYFVQSILGQCGVSQMPVNIIVNPVYDPQFHYTSSYYCAATAINKKPVINNPNGGTFSASPAGLVFVSNTTGEINLNASAPGDYVITFVGNGSCAGIETTALSVGTAHNPNFSYNEPFCQNSPNQFPVFPPLCIAGTFSSTPAGLVFANTSTGEIDLVKSIPGTYTITNSLGTIGSCLSSSFSSLITINQAVLVNAGNSQTVPAGTTIQLSGSIKGGVTTGTWSGGAGTFSNPSALNSQYTPGPGETVAKLTLTSATPTGPCGPESASVIILFNSQLAAPTVQSVQNCAGSSVTLTASAPGGIYQWFDALTGGNQLSTGQSFTTPVLNSSKTYYVQTTLNGFISARTTVTVTVNAVPLPPMVKGAATCSGSVTTLTASGSAGTYEWYDAAAGGNLLSTGSTFTTPALSAGASYYVQTTVNGCISTRAEADVTVTQSPLVTSDSKVIICSGQPLNYIITSNVPAATFNWSRAQAIGISNPAVSNQTSAVITEALLNTTSAPINVIYVITPLTGTCSGPPFNYVVTVNPAPIITSPSIPPICNMTPDNYAVTFSAPVSNFSWSRAAVPGISNQPITGQAATDIKEVLFNTTNDPISVNYTFNYKTSTCDGTPFNLAITVNPQAYITSADSGLACTGYPLDYTITSNLASATFMWSRGPTINISNPPVKNQTSSSISETLINTCLTPVIVEYDIVPTANDCTGTFFKYFVTVNPKLIVTHANSNSPVCVGSAIHLSTQPIPGATFLWTGPNGFTSTEQNPTIPNSSTANSGTYVMVYSFRGCSGLPVSVEVNVNEPPTADAGGIQTACITSTSITLNGKIGGGTTTGFWTTAGTGTFSPSSNDLQAEYIPSAADKASGSVILTLTSASKDNCVVATSNTTINFGKKDVVSAGPDQAICSQSTNVKVTGTVSIPGGTIWSTSGTGSFDNPGQLDANYTPSAADIKGDSVVLTLTANEAGPCFTPAAHTTITFIPPPKVYAGGTKYIIKTATAVLDPTVSDPTVHYLWSPNVDINNDTLKNPTITGDIDRTYTLTVTDSVGCVSQDTVQVKVSPEIKMTNTFTPNGDGINDKWDIIGLIAYEQATVDIFNRYGQQVFHSLGYPIPWNGTIGGKQVPSGVYYYLIDTHFNGLVLSGSVTVIR